MERTIRRIFILLTLIILGLSPSWANQPSTLTDPVKGKTSNPETPKGHHRVEKGDTYYSLSRRYHVPVDLLKSWNGEILKLGTTIRVSPSASTTASTKAKVTPPAKATKAQTAKNAGTYTGPAGFAPAKKKAQRVLVIPFDPYLYFSDADNDIARQSGIAKQNVRYTFRSRLNALMDPDHFESIDLLGTAFRKHKNEVDRIYKQVSYSFQPVVYSKYNRGSITENAGREAVAWLQKQKNKLTTSASPEAAGNTSVARDQAKYFGVKVKDAALYSYFNQKYAVDYYLFLNQFEIHTDYTNCLDRTQNDFTRKFVVHYSLFDNRGMLISGNKISIAYISHVNDIEKIIRDNLNQIARHILADLPQPEALASASR